MKKISIIMSFVALIAATTIIGTALFRNKGQSIEPPSQPPVKTEVRKIPVNPNVTPFGLTGTSHVVDDPPILPRVPIQQPPVYSEQPPVQTSQPLTGPIIQKPDQLFDANSAYTFAMGDLLTIPEVDQPYIRYLSLYNIPKENRREVAAVISWMVNSLSTRKKMYIPEFVGASSETLVRLDIRHYEWRPEAWEKLGLKGSGARPFPEPYFHYIVENPILAKQKVKKEIVKTKKVFSHYDQFRQPVWKDQQTKEFVEVEEIVSNKRELKVSTEAPWLDPLAVKTLIKFTHSEFPVFRADWFLANVSLPPAYYDFLKLGNKDADFDNLVFANEKLAAKAKSQDKAVVITSMVTRNNRTLNRSPTLTGGYYWKSHDTLKSVDDRNYVQFLLDEKFDATEDIGTLPNGLQAYFLTDGAGNRIDFANPDVAIDNTAIDRVVRTGRSCMICHADGIRPINDEVRALTRKLQNREQVSLLVTRKEDALRIEDLFSSDLDEQIIKDQNLYRSAVARASGLQSEVVARIFSTIYNSYAEELITSETLSREVGINFSDLQTYIRSSKDSLVLGLIKNPVRPIRRDQWETSYQRFMILIMARKRGLDHADPFPPGPLITLPHSKP